MNGPAPELSQRHRTPASSPAPGDRQVDAGGLRWHVLHLRPADGRPEPAAPTAGPLLLLHGTGSSAHSWQGLMTLLCADTELLAVDLPGHAGSGPLPAGRRSLPGMAAAVADLLQVLGLQPRAVLGHSAGAAVMLQLALDGRLPAARLIGLNAALLPFDGWAGMFYAPLARLLAGRPWLPQLAAWRARDRGAVRRLIAATGSRLDDQDIDRYAQLLQDPAHLAGALTMMANWDLHPLQQQLPHLQRPLHLLVADGDRTVPASQARQLAARWPRVRLHALPGLGHLAHEEAPEQVLAALRPLLDDDGPIPPPPAAGTQAMPRATS